MVTMLCCVLIYVAVSVSFLLILANFAGILSGGRMARTRCTPRLVTTISISGVATTSRTPASWPGRSGDEIPATVVAGVY
jgi:hypothetical protein